MEGFAPMWLGGQQQPLGGAAGQPGCAGLPNSAQRQGRHRRAASDTISMAATSLLHTSNAREVAFAALNPTQEAGLNLPPTAGDGLFDLSEEQLFRLLEDELGGELHDEFHGSGSGLPEALRGLAGAAMQPESAPVPYASMPRQAAACAPPEHRVSQQQQQAAPMEAWTVSQEPVSMQVSVADPHGQQQQQVEVSGDSSHSAASSHQPLQLVYVRRPGQGLIPELLDPKKAKRILANRISAHKSRLRKMQRTKELEAELQAGAQKLEASWQQLNALRRRRAEQLQAVTEQRNALGALRLKVAQQMETNSAMRAHICALQQRREAAASASPQEPAPPGVQPSSPEQPASRAAASGIKHELQAQANQAQQAQQAEQLSMAGLISQAASDMAATNEPCMPRLPEPIAPLPLPPLARPPAFKAAPAPPHPIPPELAKSWGVFPAAPSRQPGVAGPPTQQPQPLLWPPSEQDMLQLTPSQLAEAMLKSVPIAQSVPMALQAGSAHPHNGGAMTQPQKPAQPPQAAHAGHANASAQQQVPSNAAASAAAAAVTLLQLQQRGLLSSLPAQAAQPIALLARALAQPAANGWDQQAAGQAVQMHQHKPCLRLEDLASAGGQPQPAGGEGNGQPTPPGFLPLPHSLQAFIGAAAPRPIQPPPGHPQPPAQRWLQPQQHGYGQPDPGYSQGYSQSAPAGGNLLSMLWQALEHRAAPPPQQQPQQPAQQQQQQPAQQQQQQQWLLQQQHQQQWLQLQQQQQQQQEQLYYPGQQVQAGLLQQPLASAGHACVLSSSFVMPGGQMGPQHGMMMAGSAAANAAGAAATAALNELGTAALTAALTEMPAAAAGVAGGMTGRRTSCTSSSADGSGGPLQPRASWTSGSRPGSSGGGAPGSLPGDAMGHILNATMPHPAPQPHAWPQGLPPSFMPSLI